MAQGKVNVNCRYDSLYWMFTLRWRKAILHRRIPKHEKSMANIYVNNLTLTCKVM